LPVGQIGGLEFKPHISSGDAPFSPADISGLELWLKSDSGTYQDSAKTIVSFSAGDVVGAWADQSANGNDATQTTTLNKPTLRLAVANNRPVIRFDGLNDYIDFADVFSGLTAAEMFIVIKAANDPSIGTAGAWQFGSTSATAHYPFTDGIIYDDWGSTLRRNTGDPVTPLNQFNVYNVVTIAGEWTSFINGTQHFTSVANTVSFTISPRLGANDVPNSFLEGDIGEVIIYDAKLSAGNKSDVETYLGARWGIVFS